MLAAGTDGCDNPSASHSPASTPALIDQQWPHMTEGCQSVPHMAVRGRVVPNHATHSQPWQSGAKPCHTWPSVAEWCQTMPHMASHGRVVPNHATHGQPWLSGAKPCHTWPAMAEWCQTMPRMASTVVLKIATHEPEHGTK